MNSSKETKTQKCWRITTPDRGALIDPLLLVLQPLLEALLEEGELGDEVGDGVHEGVVWGVVGGRLDPYHYLEQSLLRTKKNSKYSRLFRCSKYKKEE